MRKNHLRITVLLSICCIIFFNASCEKEDSKTEKRVNVTYASECKNDKFINQKTAEVDSVWYCYSGSTLQIKHYNAAFNCCPGGYYFDLSFSADTIIIEEHENAALCGCNCLYDVFYTIKDIKTDSYVIKIIEPYVPSGNPQLIFNIDLSLQTSGSFFITRNFYPWM